MHIRSTEYTFLAYIEPHIDKSNDDQTKHDVDDQSDAVIARDGEMELEVRSDNQADSAGDVNDSSSPVQHDPESHLSPRPTQHTAAGGTQTPSATTAAAAAGGGGAALGPSVQFSDAINVLSHRIKSPSVVFMRPPSAKSEKQVLHQMRDTYGRPGPGAYEVTRGSELVAPAGSSRRYRNASKSPSAVRMAPTTAGLTAGMTATAAATAGLAGAADMPTGPAAPLVGKLYHASSQPRESARMAAVKAAAPPPGGWGVHVIHDTQRKRPRDLNNN